MGILQPGTSAPLLELPDAHRAPFRLADALARGPLVLVFLPFAFSRGCSAELAELREHRALFADAGVEVVGVSTDSVYALRAWDEAEGYGVRLLSDFWPHGAVARAYGAFDDDRGFATRASFVIGTDGSVCASFEVPAGEMRPIDRYRRAIGSLTRGC